ncbi:MAG: hypothetical protein R3293_23370, partial [Candidatus Promineifilaceae bacterium]|nr:hypothetical protein [Candidatus Promineifilaceae bacterium]
MATLPMKEIMLGLAMSPQSNQQQVLSELFTQALPINQGQRILFSAVNANQRINTERISRRDLALDTGIETIEFISALRKEDLLDGDELTEEKLKDFQPNFPGVFELGLHNNVKKQLNTEGSSRRDIAVKTIEFIAALRKEDLLDG